jgi:hypothetical protein
MEILRRAGENPRFDKFVGNEFGQPKVGPERSEE